MTLKGDLGSPGSTRDKVSMHVAVHGNLNLLVQRELSLVGGVG